ncbi:c-type cytochrome [Jannaschia seohaensis]|uniref:Cytochrome c556 n=1 Tax=Jannaschia seohaensis TaxID=475081 RepID=A0A2Y9AJ86_9RHOB|nr:cytochrome c [Jannaschia seohaensis]PWJ20455.1 cytochrome c556 [Jannaschia seohaensis]SSA44551.1 Cytochrome c556 [Jannaschia seohaensis]
MKLIPLALASALVVGGTVALAQSDVPAAVKARQGQMQIQALSIGILAGMARGNIEYDAELAAGAAHNLKSSTEMNLAIMWPEGTSSDEVMSSRALPVIWEDWAGFEAEWASFTVAVDAMEAAAPQGLEALQGAIGGVGRGCGSCHENWQLSNN